MQYEEVAPVATDAAEMDAPPLEEISIDSGFNPPLEFGEGDGAEGAGAKPAAASDRNPDDVTKSDEDEWRGAHGGRINSRDDAMGMIARLDSRNSQLAQDNTLLRQELAEIRAEMRAQRNAPPPSARTEAPRVRIPTRDQFMRAYEADPYQATLDMAASIAAAHGDVVGKKALAAVENTRAEMGRHLGALSEGNVEIVAHRDAVRGDALLEAKLGGLPKEFRQSIVNEVGELIRSNAEQFTKRDPVTGQPRTIDFEGAVYAVLGRNVDKIADAKAKHSQVRAEERKKAAWGLRPTADGEGNVRISGEREPGEREELIRIARYRHSQGMSPLPDVSKRLKELGISLRLS